MLNTLKKGLLLYIVPLLTIGCGKAPQNLQNWAPINSVLKVKNQSTKEIQLQPLFLGISGLHLNEQERNLLKQHQPMGFILFKRNIQDRAQLIALIKEIKGLYDDKYEPLIFIDQEGGRVARLRPPVVQNTYPPAAYFGKMYVEDGKERAIQATYDNYSKIGQDLKTLNIDSPCAPDADLHHSDTTSAIGDRSFGSEIEQVTKLATAAIKSLQDQGRIAIIKHMPGHGRAIVDSHTTLPYVTTPIEELEKTDFEVFRRLAQDNQDICAMTAHIVYKYIDQQNPITLSSKGIQYIRDKIGFQGIITTDAIEMGALHGNLYPQYKLATIPFDGSDAAYEQLQKNAELRECVDACIKQGIMHSVKDLPALRKNANQIKLQFANSLVDKAHKALEAGCNIILYSGGDIEQMTKLCEGVQAIPIELNCN